MVPEDKNTDREINTVKDADLKEVSGGYTVPSLTLYVCRSCGKAVTAMTEVCPNCGGRSFSKT